MQNSDETELARIKMYLTHHRIAIYAIVAFLLSFTLLIVTSLQPPSTTSARVENKTPQVENQEPSVTLKTDYQNPFDKSTQYVNPFSDYKNPFDAIE